MGTDILGDKISGAPNGAVGVRSGVANPGMAGDSKRCVSTAEAANRRHSSSHAGTKNSTNK